MLQPAASPDRLEARLRRHVNRLASEIGERNTFRYPAMEEAREYVEQQLEESGYELRHDVFEAAGLSCRNVIAELAGEQAEAPLLIVGAHYDTAPGTPGADDNASAVAVLLETARILREETPRQRIRWVAFALEEPPFFGTPQMGSWVHARKCREQEEPLTGMISLEMLGYYRDAPGSQTYPLPLMSLFYPVRGDFIAAAGNFRSRHLVGRLTRLLRSAGKIPVESVALPFVPGTGLSDNWAFWQEGFPALMLTDTAFFRNPHYHRPTDEPGTLDYARMARLVEALTEALPEM